MAKLQKIIRKDETVIHSINLPTAIINEVGWNKGDIIDVESDNDLNIILKKVENGNN